MIKQTKRLQLVLNVIKSISDATPLTPQILGILNHPLLEYNVICDENKNMILVTEKNRVQVFERIYSKMAECKTIQQMFYRFIRKADRLMILFHVHLLLNETEFNELLHWAWITCEFPHQMKTRDLLKLFNHSNKDLIMSKNEQQVIQKLPDNVTIYRGLQGPKAKIKGFAWTLSKDKAVWFARRFNYANAKVYSAKIAKEHIFMYTNDRSEQEVVINPKHLTNITECESVYQDNDVVDYDECDLDEVRTKPAEIFKY